MRAPRGYGTAALGLLAEGPALFLSVPLWVWWASWHGAESPTIWIPGLAYLAAVAAVLVVGLGAPRATRTGYLAVGVWGLYSGWASLSLLWASDKGVAWIAAERSWLLGAAFALPVLWPPTRRGLDGALIAWCGACVAGAASGLIGALQGQALVDGRLEAPTGYPNATAAVFVMGALVGFGLAGGRDRAVGVRVAGLAAAGALADAAVLTQSRGAVGAGVLAALIGILWRRRRLELLAPGLLLLAAVAAGIPAMLAVHRQELAAGGHAALARAVAVIVLTAGVLAAAGAALALTESRAGPVLRRRAARCGRALVVLLVAGAAAGTVAATGNPVRWASDRLDSLGTPDYGKLDSGSSRFTGDLGSYRTDYWRVAVKTWREAPVAGKGADNFAAPYLRLRRPTGKGPQYAHSIWLGALEGLGVVGAILLLAWVGTIARGAFATRRRDPPGWRGAAGTALLPLLFLLLQGSEDWIDTFAAVSVPAFALAGGALAAVPGPRMTLRGGLPGVALGVVAALAALAGLPLFLSLRLTDRALHRAAADPAGALAELRRAGRLNPLGPVPSIEEGAVALASGRTGEARRAYREAHRRDGQAWFPPFMLAVIAADSGARPEALAQMRLVRARDPQDPLVDRVEREIHAGKRPNPLQTQQIAINRPA